jgi:hypothetical protein
LFAALPTSPVVALIAKLSPAELISRSDAAPLKSAMGLKSMP